MTSSLRRSVRFLSPSLATTVSAVVLFAAMASFSFGQRIAQTGGTIKRLDDMLGPIIQQHYPNAQFFDTSTTYSARARAMHFSVHMITPKGVWSSETRMVEGPNSDGFILLLELVPGRYQGVAKFPQQLRGPYWETYLNVRHTSGDSQHIKISFSYGSTIKPAFKTAMLQALGATAPVPRAQPVARH